jgi:sortase A
MPGVDPRRRRAVLLAVERALFAIAIVALGWVAYVLVSTRVDQAAQNQALENLRAAQQATSGTPPAGAPPPESPGPRARPAHRSLVGRIEVARLGIRAIVREGVDDGTLLRAVGHVPDTALPGEPGNAALAAHRDSFFRPLRHVRTGDRITVTTPDGVHEYRVTDTRVVPPEDVSVLAPTPQPTLTLVTCHPFDFVGAAPNRFIVRAERTGAVAAPAAAAAASMAAMPVKAGEAIGESEPGKTEGVKTETRKADGRRKVAKAKRTTRTADRPAAAEPSPKRLGPWRKFLTLFTGPPEPSERPSRTSRDRTSK